jgi:hypothetical protein
MCRRLPSFCRLLFLLYVDILLNPLKADSRRISMAFVSDHEQYLLPNETIKYSSAVDMNGLTLNLDIVENVNLLRY